MHAFPPTLCSLFLSIIRPGERRTVVGLFKGFFPIREHQLVTVVAYRYGSQVKLELGRLRLDIPLDRVNQLLRECQHLRHLKVPSELINFDSSDSSFTSNPQFLTLEIMPILDGMISVKLLDG
jgi:hypothetical protein